MKVSAAPSLIERAFDFKLLIAGIFIIFSVTWFYTLGARTLVPSDEARYAEVAREMAASGDFVTPRLNGIKYFEKPPLQYWVTALTFRAFGVGEWQARLWTGLCGLATILLIAFTGRRVFNEWTGVAAGLIIASSFYWALSSHINSLDVGVAAMLTLALCALLLAQRHNATMQEQRRWMLVCWSGMALAVLSKGLIGMVLPGATLVIYILSSRDWAIVKRLHAGAGLALFFIITVPWFVLVSLANPEFPNFFFIHEHFQRFTSNIHRREGSLYYFVPYLAFGVLPWLGAFPGSIWNARQDGSSRFQPKKLLLIWVLFVFFFFSISSSKLPGYIVPVFPALALLIAHYLKTASHRPITLSAVVFGLFCAIGLGIAFKLPVMAKAPYEVALYRASQPWIAGSAIVGLAGAMLGGWQASRRREAALMILAAGAFISSQVLLLGYEPLARYKAGTLHLDVIQAELTPQTPLYSVGQYEHALPFYLRRTLILVGHADEMEFGLGQEPQLWIPDTDAFLDTWKADRMAGKKAVAILRPSIYEDWQKRNVPMRILAQDPRRIIVTNE